MTKEELIKENDKKKEYLRSYIFLKNRAKRLEEELKEFRSGKMCPSFFIDDMPHSTDKKDLSCYAVALDERISEIIKARHNAVTKYTEIFRKIEMMEEEIEKDILTLKYLRGMTFEQVSVEIGYSWRQTLNLHGKALKNFEM